MKQALRDISDALVYEIQGRAVSFMPPDTTLEYDATEQCFIYKLGMYNNLVISFYVHEDMDCMMVIIEVDGIFQNLNIEEEGVLFELFEALDSEGYINESCKQPA